MIPAIGPPLSPARRQPVPIRYGDAGRAPAGGQTQEPDRPGTAEAPKSPTSALLSAYGQMAYPNSQSLTDRVSKSRCLVYLV